MGVCNFIFSNKKDYIRLNGTSKNQGLQRCLYFTPYRKMWGNGSQIFIKMVIPLKEDLSHINQVQETE